GGRSMLTRVLCSSFAGLAALLTAGIALPTSANATTYPVTLNVSNCCGSGPFGTVNITQDAQIGGVDTVEGTVALTQAGTQFVNTGLDASFAFNLAFGSVTISDITSDGPVFTANNTSGGVTTAGSGKTLIHMDGGGFFTYGISLTGSQGGSNSG